MSIFIGNNEIDNVFIGNNEIENIFIGNEEVWTNNKVIDLGTSTSFNVRTILNNLGYTRIDTTQFTADNFFFLSADKINNFGKTMGHSYWAPTGFYDRDTHIVKSYDASTSVLSFKEYCAVGDRTMGQGVERSGNVHAYLVTKPSKLISLGTGTSFDLTSYEGYQNFTIDNFLIKTNSSHWNVGSYSEGATFYNHLTFVKSYTNGILTCYFDSASTLTTTVYLYKKGV